jgi:HlyD family secretion protein
MKRNLIISAVVVAVLLITYFVVSGNKKAEDSFLMANVQRGPFKVEIETTGELEAKNSVKITGPAGLRDFRIYQTTIQKIVDEGTVVQKGDWVATLDRSEFETRFSDMQINLDRENAEFIQTQLDTTLELRQARDELINLKYAVEEKQIILEQSKFEPPATIKQAEINKERAEREYKQAVQNYKIKKRKNEARMREQNAELRKVQSEYNAMMKLMQDFKILAPEAGMVIYMKGRDGRPIKEGSQINLWEPTVATLPDLTKMMSRTYVNEVDVRKIKPGQKVEIGLDAYPDKKLSGVVTKVANVGEQRPNSDAKVFEVFVEINGTDPTLRPAMTTSNKIITTLINDALFVPLECLHSHMDSISYVFMREGLATIKQEVIVGETNANDAVILGGLSEGDRVYMSMPSGHEDKEITLLPEMDGKRKQQQEEMEEPNPDERPDPAVRRRGRPVSQTK